MTLKRKAVIQAVKKVKEEKQAAMAEPQKVQKEDFRDYLNVFEFATTLPGTGQLVRFKPLTIGNLKRLLTFDVDNLEDIEPKAATEMFDEIFRQSVLSEDFNVDDIYIQDRYFLLLEIRKKTKGEKNEYQMQCPQCNSQSQQIINFDNIQVKQMNRDADPVIKLTDSLSVAMRHIKRFEEKEVYDIWDEIKEETDPKQKESEISILLEAQSIDSIITPSGPQEDITIWDKKYLLENIPSTLYEKISNWHTDNTFGPDLKAKLKCPHCGFEAEHNMGKMDFFS